jgi:cation transport ATPase
VFDTRNIRQNSFFAFIYNGLSIPIAAGARFTRSSLASQPDDCRRPHSFPFQ